MAYARPYIRANEKKRGRDGPQVRLRHIPLRHGKRRNP
jgi:hypothetical protein